MLPRQSGEFISKLSKSVFIQNKGVSVLAKEIVERLRNKTLSVQNFSQHELHPQVADHRAVDWIFLVDTLNFSFWTHEDSSCQWEVEFSGKKYTGYFALCAAVNRALQENIPITQPEFYATVSREKMSHILRSSTATEVPLLEERVACLHEAGRALIDKYQGKYPEFHTPFHRGHAYRKRRNTHDLTTTQSVIHVQLNTVHCKVRVGVTEMYSNNEKVEVLLIDGKCSFVNCIEQVGNSAQKLLQLIVQNFPSYRDEAEYEGCKVSFYKRAQILIGDIWACFEGKGLGYLTDIDTITMFADYRVPQSLLHFGVLKYSNELLTKLKTGLTLENGSQDEVEIRGCSIHAVELVRQQVLELLVAHPDHSSGINSILVDHFLWDYRRDHAHQLAHLPFHKTRCIYY